VTVFLEKYLLPILAGLSLVVLATNPMHFSWPQRIVSLLVFLLLAWLVSWDIHRRNKKKAPSTETEMKEEDRIFVPVKPQDLMKIYRNNTDIQANQLAASYMDLWIQVSGIVSEVSRFDDKSVSVSLNLSLSDGSAPGYFLLFPTKPWLERLQILPRGHSITVNGQIRRIYSTGLTLWNCELVEAVGK
jgi:hypothetical protein